MSPITGSILGKSFAMPGKIGFYCQALSAHVPSLLAFGKYTPNFPGIW
jgi:hypothetical protein